MTVLIDPRPHDEATARPSSAPSPASDLGDAATRDRTTPLLVAVAIVTIGFQAIHTSEHLAQFTYWLSHPGVAPWLSPMAEAGRDALTASTGLTTTGGTELLHLLGNLAFLAGLLAVEAIVRRPDRTVVTHVASATRALRAATDIQALHVLEHVALTVSASTTGTAIGVTTLLGTATGAGGIALRISSHLAINLAASGLTVLALHELRGRRG